MAAVMWALSAAVSHGVQRVGACHCAAVRPWRIALWRAHWVRSATSGIEAVMGAS
jgi:hypothetical protein